METISICILTLLGVFAMMLWLVFHFNRVQRDLEEEVHSVKQNLEGNRARIIQLDEAQKKVQAVLSPETGGARVFPKDGTLTIDGIAEALVAAGYELKERVADQGMTFTKDGHLYVLDTRNMPRFCISINYQIDPKEWDLERMQHAAHQLSDRFIMVKAFVDTDLDEEGNMTLSFRLIAMDRTYRSFTENLEEYLGILDRGSLRMREIYEHIEKERGDASALNTLANSSFQQNGKIPS